MIKFSRACRNENAVKFMLPVILLFSQAMASDMPVDYKLSKISEAYDWTSPNWGYNAPKLVYDGQSYYAVSHWGKCEPNSTSALYKFENGKWVKGFEHSMNYQMPIVLLDSQKRIILILPQDKGLKMFRSPRQGEFNNLSEMDVPAKVSYAGYVGAGIYNDKLVIGSIGEPNLYSFNLNWIDLKTMQWHGPFMLAPEQRRIIPYTTWLYPIIQPDHDGIHIALTNSHEGMRYNRVFYMVLPWDIPAGYKPKTELIAPSDTSQDWNVHAQAMLRDRDGWVYVTAFYNPQKGSPVQEILCRRDPASGQWSQIKIAETSGDLMFGAPYIAPSDPDRLWIIAAYRTEIRLYSSTNKGANWESIPMKSFEPYNFTSASFMHLLNPASGSVMPDQPRGVFQESKREPGRYDGIYRLWMIEIELPKAK